MARRRSRTRTAAPSWITDPITSDYLTREQVANDELWPWRALTKFAAALDRHFSGDAPGDPMQYLRYPRNDFAEVVLAPNARTGLIRRDCHRDPSYAAVIKHARPALPRPHHLESDRG